MSTELTPEQQQFVDAQIAVGLFKNPNEVIETALSLLKTRQQEYDQLDSAIAQDQRGQHAEMDLDGVKARGRHRLTRK